MSALNPRSRRIPRPTSRSGSRDGISASHGTVELPVMPTARAPLDDRIDHALELTFPASDPPTWQSFG